ncbi:hypothetical protein V8C86DRAFT_454871 [Haematococcus lacustris]
MADYARAQVQAAVSAGHMKGSVLVVEGDLTSFQLQQVQPQQRPTVTTATPAAAVGFSKAAAAAAARQWRGPEAAGRVGEGGVGRQGGGAAEQQFDMVTCLLAGLSHLLDNSQAAAAFACVARVLKPGGLFVVELAHPGDLFDGGLVDGASQEVWEVALGDNKLMVEWGTEVDEFDPVTQVLSRHVSLNVLAGEEVVQSVQEVVACRQFTVQEVRLLAAHAGLSLQGLYGDMSEGVDMTHEEAYRMVAVLRKD